MLQIFFLEKKNSKSITVITITMVVCVCVCVWIKKKLFLKQRNEKKNYILVIGSSSLCVCWVHEHGDNQLQINFHQKNSEKKSYLSSVGLFERLKKKKHKVTTAKKKFHDEIFSVLAFCELTTF